MKTSTFSGFLTAIALLSAGLLQAQLINVNFVGNSVGIGYGGGGPASPGPSMTGAGLIGSGGDIWNNVGDSQLTFASYPTGITTPTPIGLMYSTGINSPVMMNIIATSTYNATEPGWGNTSAFVTAGSPYANLMQDCIVAQAADTITLTGLPANTSYQLVLYNSSDQNVGTGRTSTFTVNGVTQTSVWDGTTSTLVAGVTYVDYASAMTDGTGTLVINYGVAGGTGALETDLNGFQLQQVPEPASLAMLGVAGMMFVGWRRRLARA